MGRKLKSIILYEISGVDVPADPNARIVLMKRATMEELREKPKGGDMDPQELAKQLKVLEGQVADLTKRAETAETVISTMKAAAEKAGLDVADDGSMTKRADPEYIEIDGEKVEKSAVPAPILKRLEAQQAEIEKMAERQRNADLAKRGSTELPNMAGSDLAKGRLLDLIGDDKDLLETLKAADAAVKFHTEEIGSTMVDETSAHARLTKMATDYAAEKGVPFETAFAEVTKAGIGRDLMNEARKEAN